MGATQPRDPVVERTALPRHARGTGPWLAVTPMLTVIGLTIGAAPIVGATAKATAALGRPKEAAVAGAEQMRRQALAVQAFQARDYPMAYGRFAELADAGDALSALMALAMVRHGPLLFGSDWSVTPGQVHRRSAMALREVHDHGLAIAQHDKGNEPATAARGALRCGRAQIVLARSPWPRPRCKPNRTSSSSTPGPRRC